MCSFFFFFFINRQTFFFNCLFIFAFYFILLFASNYSLIIFIYLFLVEIMAPLIGGAISTGVDYEGHQLVWLNWQFNVPIASHINKRHTPVEFY